MFFIFCQDDNHMPQDDLDDAGALDLDLKDAEYKVPNVLSKKHESNKYKRRKLYGDTDSSQSNGDGLAVDASVVKSEVLSESDGHDIKIEGSSITGSSTLMENPEQDNDDSFLTSGADGQTPVCQVN